VVLTPQASPLLQPSARSPPRAPARERGTGCALVELRDGEHVRHGAAFGFVVASACQVT